MTPKQRNQKTQKVKEFIAQKWIPGEIMYTTEPLSYWIQIDNKRIICHHVDHIKSRSVITVNSPSQPYTNDTIEFDLFPTPSHTTIT